MAALDMFGEELAVGDWVICAGHWCPSIAKVRKVYPKRVDVDVIINFHNFSEDRQVFDWKLLIGFGRMLRPHQYMKITMTPELEQKMTMVMLKYQTFKRPRRC